VALSADLHGPESYLPLDVGGVPILLVRDREGRVRAFVNGCRHRGSPIATERGCAEGGTLRCPFHSWTYSTQGQLTNIPLGEEGFASLDRSRMGLHSRACLEVEGLIFVRAEGEEPIDESVALAGVRDDLHALGLERYRHFETRTSHWRCNWKLVLDTFLESYHVFSLHRKTVHPWYFSQPMIYDGWGCNLRFPVARRTIQELDGRPEEDWRLTDHATVQWLVASNALLTHTRDHVLLWRFTSAQPNRCEVRTSFYSTSPAETEEDEERLSAAFDRQLRVTGDEDFPAQERIQSVLDSGALPEIVLGRNEVAPIHFHRSLQVALDEGGSR
jgi:phenylpropionate dioxygenase-like ring-hydroxylating dioxygenase large terminal subunit